MRDIKVGDRCTIEGRSDTYTFRVMAIAEGYAMLRYPRAMPFAEPLKNLRKTGDNR